MTAGPRYEYHWSDGSSKPVKCSAPDVSTEILKSEYGLPPKLKRLLLPASDFQVLLFVSFSAEARITLPKI